MRLQGRFDEIVEARRVDLARMPQALITRGSQGRQVPVEAKGLLEELGRMGVQSAFR